VVRRSGAKMSENQGNSVEYGECDELRARKKNIKMNPF
jgi:hypothetical protein